MIAGDHHECVVTRDCRHDAGAHQPSFDRVEIDSQPERLDEPAHPPDDLEHPAPRVDSSEVTGAEFRQLGAPFEIGKRACIAHHHVRAGVDDLTDAVVGGGGLIEANPDRAAGHGNTHRLGRQECRRRWQVRHSRRGFGLAVHHVEVPATISSARRPGSNHVRWEAASRLRHVAQRRCRPVVESGGSEQFECVGYAREPGDGRLRQRRTEPSVGHRHVAHLDRSAGPEMRMQHRQAVAVRHREGGDGPIVRCEAQVLGDRRSISDERPV